MNYKDFFKEDILPGGKGDETSPSQIDPSELSMGIKVEMEHTKDSKLAREIALDHLTEDPHYYSKLKHAGLADELDNKKAEEAVVEPKASMVKKQTEPVTVFPEVPFDTSNGPDMIGCIGSTADISNQDKTDVESPAKDPEPGNNITGAMGSTPSNPNILQKQSNSQSSISIPPSLQSIVPKDIQIDIVEGKKILEKMKEDVKSSPTVKGSATAFGPKQEGVTPAAGDPDKDHHFVKGKRWTVKW